MAIVTSCLLLIPCASSSEKENLLCFVVLTDFSTI